MSERKRESTSKPPISAVDKRIKLSTSHVSTNHNESHESKSIRTTKYSFGPRNTLVDPPKSREPHNDAESQINVLPSEIIRSPNVQHVMEKPAKTPKRTTNTKEYSDDPHIFWQTTPRVSMSKNSRVLKSNTKNKPNSNLPSSPLRETPVKKDDPIFGLSNKYNTGFENILSQTPFLVRRSSDPGSSELKLHVEAPYQQSPTLLRTKSTGFRDIEASIGISGDSNRSILQKSGSKTNSISKLNKLVRDVAMSFSIDDSTCMEVDTPNTDEKSLQNITSDFSDIGDISYILSKTQKEDSKELDESQLNGRSILEPSSNAPVPEVSFVTEDFSDFTDDDDDELDKFLSARESSLPKESQTPKQTNQEDEENDFDDDENDELENELEIVLTQTSHAKKTLSTQEQSDKKNAAIFQRDMKRSESPATLNNMTVKEENLAKVSFQREGLSRYQILDVIRGKYTVNNRSRDQVILSVINSNGDKTKVVVRGEYSQLDFEKNEVIHVIGENPKLVDDSGSVLIWNPDILVSATSVGDAHGCARRSVLKARLSYPGESSIPLIVGCIVHNIFQECLTKGDSSTEFIKPFLNSEINSFRLSIYSLGDIEHDIRNEVWKHIPYIQSWFSDYFRAVPSGKAMIPTNNSKEKTMFAASKVLDIEENIWSPMFGLKGLIDVTIEATIKNSASKGKFLMPMEIKTGAKEQISNRIQASLYTLLSRDRYDMDITSFLLVFTQLKSTVKHDITPNDLRSLINIRNRISKFLKDGQRVLPPLIKQSQCDRCFASESCMTVNKLSENGSAAESGMQEGIYDDLTLHLENDKYKDFYNYWDDLITKEEGMVTKLKKELWLLTAKEREKNGGKGVGGLVIKNTNDHEDSQTEFIYTFERPSGMMNSSIQQTQLSRHDRVIISDEEGHFALCQGVIEVVRPSFVVVKTRRRIINSSVQLKDFDIHNNQTFQSVLHTLDSTGISQVTQSTLASKTYRIDKDEMFHGLALARYNLLHLFLKHSGDMVRRELLVDMRPPVFANKPIPYTPPAKENFNEDQLAAFDKVLKTQDYSLILGMPGTGKTTVIAQLIRFMVQSGKTVLLASYTHSAVDNILIKLKDDKIPILRAGNHTRVHPEVKHLVPGYKDDSAIKTYSGFVDTYMEPRVVATTCLGINDIVFSLRKNFDYCIIDEASQVSMPICLGPLRFCDKFVLVGDHNQLPPLIVNPEARGLAKSLFKSLSDSFPESVVELSYQYRMCSDIMLLSNTLIYQGRLKSGDEKVANQVLKIPHPENLANSLIASDLAVEKQWMELILKENNRVIFLNHDNVPATEKVVGDKVANPIEAELVRQIVEGLLACGVEEKSIGVMSVYRAQLRLLMGGLIGRNGVEILTADQFQGRDKDCIIISLVRSNDRNTVGDLLKDWRRVNVAITRAKSKLIILGSRNTMKALDTLQAFMDVIETRGWMYDLPENAQNLYQFMLSSQINTSPSSSSKRVVRNTLTIDSTAVQKSSILRDIINEVK